MASKKNDKKSAKSSPQKKPGRVLTTAQKVKNLDENVIKQVLEDKKEEMSIEANKIAKEMAARMDLAIDTDTLTDLQKTVALKFGSGFSIQEVCDEYNILPEEFKQWMKIPAFAKQVTEYIYSEGMVDKGERIRSEKRMLEAIRDEIFDRIQNNDLKSVNLTTLFKLWQDINPGFSDKVDEKKDDSGTRDISILIVNHYKSQGKNYDTLDQFLTDPSFKFDNYIDVESEDA